MRTGKSWLTFNRSIKEGEDSLNEWLSTNDNETISKFILKLNDMNKISGKTTSDLKSRKLLKKLLVNFKYLGKGTIGYKNKYIGVRSATAREYSTRSMGWTFNFLEIDSFNYMILIGYIKDEVYFWLINSDEIKKSSPPNTNTQQINGRNSFSIGVSADKNSISWNKYKKYLVNKNELKYVLDSNI